MAGLANQGAVGLLGFGRVGGFALADCLRLQHPRPEFVLRQHKVIVIPFPKVHEQFAVAGFHGALLKTLAQAVRVLPGDPVNQFRLLVDVQRLGQLAGNLSVA